LNISDYDVFIDTLNGDSPGNNIGEIIRGVLTRKIATEGEPPVASSGDSLWGGNDLVVVQRKSGFTVGQVGGIKAACLLGWGQSYFTGRL
jgi:hypothetical protein